MKDEGALKMLFSDTSDLSVRCVVPFFLPVGRFRFSGRDGSQSVGHAGKHKSCPSSAMSSGRLLDRVAR